MGELTKSITVEVPPGVIFNAIKEIHSPGWAEKYCKDLIDASGIAMANTLSKEITNSELSYVGGGWGTKFEERYSIRPLGEFSEVTIFFNYRMALAASANVAMIDTIGQLLMLEIGYKAKK